MANEIFSARGPVSFDSLIVLTICDFRADNDDDRWINQLVFPLHMRGMTKCMNCSNNMKRFTLHVTAQYAAVLRVRARSAGTIHYKDCVAL